MSLISSLRFSIVRDRGSEGHITLLRQKPDDVKMLGHITLSFSKLQC